MTMTRINYNNLTLEQFKQAVLDAESVYGLPGEIISSDTDFVKHSWLTNVDPKLMVDELALMDGLILPDDYQGDVLQYWLVLGRFEYDENQAIVVNEYNKESAIKRFVKHMREDCASKEIYIELVTSCGREYPEYSTNEVTDDV